MTLTVEELRNLSPSELAEHVERQGNATVLRAFDLEQKMTLPTLKQRLRGYMPAGDVKGAADRLVLLGDLSHGKIVVDGRNVHEYTRRSS